LNSRVGKPLKGASRVGVERPVVSDFIAATFAQVGYGTVARVGRPAAPPRAELLVMRRSAG
jgi:hypothetical protein